MALTASSRRSRRGTQHRAAPRSRFLPFLQDLPKLSTAMEHRTQRSPCKALTHCFQPAFSPSGYSLIQRVSKTDPNAFPPRFLGSHSYLHLCSRSFLGAGTHRQPAEGRPEGLRKGTMELLAVLDSPMPFDCVDLVAGCAVKRLWGDTKDPGCRG